MLNRRPVLPLAVVPVLVAVAVLGYVAGQYGAQSHTSERLRTAQAANVVVGYPAGWGLAARAPQIPGLAIEGAKAIAPAGGGSEAGLLVGALPSGELAPLPRAFLASLRRLPAPEIVDLAEIQAYKYPQLSVARFGAALTVFVIPNPGGHPTALACYARSAESPYMSICEGAVAGVTVIAQPQTYQLTPEPSYAAKISASIAALDRLRVSLRRELRPSVSAETAEGLAERLADGYATAEAAIAKLEPGFAAKAVQTALSGAIQRAQASYRSLARAARRQDATQYTAAQKRIAAAEANVDRALESFALLGYSSSAQSSAGEQPARG